MANATPDTILGEVAFDVSPATLRVTTLGELQPFSLVNLERPMAADGRFGGHLVQGHVDATGSIEALDRDGEFYWLTVSFPRELAPYFISKGSVAVDGISLTIADLQAGSLQGSDYSAYLAAHESAGRAAGDAGQPGMRSRGKIRDESHRGPTGDAWSRSPLAATRFQSSGIVCRQSPVSASPRARRAAASRRRSRAIEDAVEAIRAGRMVIVVDDEDRENEGDLTHGGGEGHAGGDQLHGHARPRPDLPVDDARAARRARHPADGEREHRRASGRRSACRSRRKGKTTTGISAADRAATIATAIDPDDAARAISRGPATCFRCARATAACWCAPARPKRRSISRAWPG